MCGVWGETSRNLLIMAIHWKTQWVSHSSLKTLGSLRDTKQPTWKDNPMQSCKFTFSAQVSWLFSTWVLPLVLRSHAWKTTGTHGTLSELCRHLTSVSRSSHSHEAWVWLFYELAFCHMTTDSYEMDCYALSQVLDKTHILYSQITHSDRNTLKIRVWGDNWDPLNSLAKIP